MSHRASLSLNPPVCVQPAGCPRCPAVPDVPLSPHPSLAPHGDGRGAIPGESGTRCVLHKVGTARTRSSRGCFPTEMMLAFCETVPAELRSPHPAPSHSAASQMLPARILGGTERAAGSCRAFPSPPNSPSRLFFSPSPSPSIRAQAAALPPLNRIF